MSTYKDTEDTEIDSRESIRLCSGQEGTKRSLPLSHKGTKKISVSLVFSANSTPKASPFDLVRPCSPRVAQDRFTRIITELSDTDSFDTSTSSSQASSGRG